MSITEMVKTALEDMTKTENKIAAYFLLNVEEFAFGTLDGVAAKMDTSTTSVIRFCKRLGFSGYKAFQDKVRADFKYEMTLPDKLVHTVKNEAVDSGFATTVGRAVNCIEQTLQNLDSNALRLSAEGIAEAKRVFCFGMKESFALAHYTYTRFLSLRSDVFLLSAGQDGEIEALLGLGEGDLCIVFLFHRYTKQSLQILKRLKKQGVKIILVTSPPFDEVEDWADMLLSCAVNIGGIKNSAVAPICVVDHLCNEVARRGGDEILEYIWNVASGFLKNLPFKSNTLKKFAKNIKKRQKQG